MTVQKRHNTNTTRRTGNTFHLQANDVTSRQILDKILPETQKRQKRFFILYYIADIFFTRHRKIGKKNYQLCHVCSSVLMKQLFSQWTYFHEIWYLKIFFEKSVEEIQVSLKSDKNKGTLHEKYCKGREESCRGEQQSEVK